MSSVEMPRQLLVLIAASMVAIFGICPAAHAEDLRLLPVPLPSPTPTPVPEEVPRDEPVPDEEPAANEKPEKETTPEPTSSGEDSVDEWEDEDGVAHTPHGPFEVDSIAAEPFDLKWSNFVDAVRGLGRYSLFDGQLKFRLGGKVQGDGTVGSGSDSFLEFHNEIENSVDLRRFRVYAAGVIKHLNFLFGFDLGADWGFKDAWVEGRKGGLTVWGHYLGKLRLGNMREPFSLERQTGGWFTSFAERSLPVQTFAPGHNLGAMVHNSVKNQRITYAVGLFSFGQKNEDNASSSVFSLTTRWTGLAKYSEQGRRLIHLGASFSTRNPLSNDTRYRSRPEARDVGFLVDTGELEASGVNLFGAEFAMVQGPVWVQAEYILSDVDAQLIGNPKFTGSYGQLGFFLTGESRPYRQNSGVFGRVEPEQNWRKGNPFKKRNGGVWEVVGRISHVDLEDELVNGGILTDISAALNWYPNATTRVQLNYIYASPKDEGSANIVVLRVAYSPW
jgi:phosphate-selective porin OprO/OprP